MRDEARRKPRRKWIEAGAKPGESMRKKYPNLIPNSERSPKELREMGRKGGLKSGEARRKKRDQEKMVKVLLQVLMEGPEAKENIEELKRIFGKENSG